MGDGRLGRADDELEIEVADPLLPAGFVDPGDVRPARHQRDGQPGQVQAAGDAGAEGEGQRGGLVDAQGQADHGDGPPAEGAQDENGIYRQVASYFFFHPVDANHYLVETGAGGADPVAGAAYTLQVCDLQRTMAPPECDKQHEFKLSADYYKGDRSMRESGCDVSSRFGPFGAATHHYAPVCLNSLLYKTEKDLEQISRYLWDDKLGLFVDFNFQTRTRSTYRYATTFYPMWAGLATPEQAKAVVKNLPELEKPGGLAVSAIDTGAQWDLPYGWGNIEMLAIAGLRRYGYNADADRISYEFLSMVAENFRRDGNIREKYNVVTRSSESHVELGYHMNVVGFGWTNAAFLDLLHDLPKDMAERLGREQDQPLRAAEK